MRYYSRTGLFKHPDAPKLLTQWFIDWVATTHHNQLSAKDFEGFDLNSVSEVTSAEGKERVRFCPKTEYSDAVISFRKEYEESVWSTFLRVQTDDSNVEGTYFYIEGCVTPFEKVAVAVDPGLMKYLRREINKFTK